MNGPRAERDRFPLAPQNLSSPQASSLSRKHHKQIGLFFTTKWPIYPLQVGTIKKRGKTSKQRQIEGCSQATVAFPTIKLHGIWTLETREDLKWDFLDLVWT